MFFFFIPFCFMNVIEDMTPHLAATLALQDGCEVVDLVNINEATSS